MQHRVLAALGSLVLLAGQAAVQAAEPALERPRAGQFLEEYVSRVMSPFRRADRDRDGLDAKDIARIDASAAALQRATRVSQVLRFDLDGDGRVALAEIETFLDGELRPTLPSLRKRQTDTVMALDRNRDGVIEFAEMLTAPPPVSSLAAGNTRLSDLLALDPNGDGKLTGEELARLAHESFSRLDRDGNDYIDDAEAKADAAAKLHDTIAGRAAALAKARTCTLPPPGADDQIVAFSAREGAYQPTVSVAGEDAQTLAARIVIAPGERPIYLVLSSYRPLIWKVEGAVARLSRVVVSRSYLGGGTAGAAGVAGVPAERITFVSGRECGGFFAGADTVEGEVARLVLERTLGRAPDIVAATRQLDTAEIPGLAPPSTPPPKPASLPPDGFDREFWQRAARAAPAGIMELAVADVVSGGEVVPYATLPAYFGLARLVGSGSIVRSGGSDFRIVERVRRLPPALFLPGRPRFLLADAVPPPETMHLLCVVRETTAERLNPRGLCPR